jgi:hypothetical protein
MAGGTRKGRKSAAHGASRRWPAAALLGAVAAAAFAVALAAGLGPSACDRPPARPAGAEGAAVAADPPPSGRSQAGLPTGVVILHPPGRDPVTVRVEFAVEPRARTRGLMHRESLAPDAGMLFVFAGPDRVQSFWMRNTLVSLDMIFADGDRQVVGVVENAEPLTDDGRSVPVPSRYVLEVNAGFASRHGIGPGTRLEIEGLDVPDLREVR